MFHVHFNRAFGDIETAGDHLVRQTLGNQLEDIALTRGQLADVAVGGGAVGAQAGRQHRGQGFAQHHVTGRRLLQGFQQLFRLHVF